MKMLDIDTAIKHCLEVAEENDLAAETYELLAENNHNVYERLTAETNSSRCAECAADHRQLAEWLKELKEWRANPFYQIKTECKNNYYCNKCAFLDHCPFSNGNRVAAEYPMDWVVY
jgi:hypothetical protein